MIKFNKKIKVKGQEGFLVAQTTAKRLKNKKQRPTNIKATEDYKQWEI